MIFIEKENGKHVYKVQTSLFRAKCEIISSAFRGLTTTINYLNDTKFYGAEERDKRKQQIIRWLKDSKSDIDWIIESLEALGREVDS